MKLRFLSAAAGFAALLPALAPAQQVTIQFGGAAAHLTDPDTNWVSQIGASQVIQWNGVNSDGGGFNASGTLVEQGVGATLTSLGSENLILTTTGISAINLGPGYPLTDAGGSPNLLGIKANDTDDRLKFEAKNEEKWTFSFNQDVTLNHMVGAAMAFNLERFGIDIGNDGTYEYEWNRSAGFIVGSGLVSAASYAGGGNRYVASPTDGIAIPANTEVTIAGLQGAIAIESLVVTTIPEPSTYALLAGFGALGLIILRRRFSKNSR